jgi:hypothetical protein
LLIVLHHSSRCGYFALKKAAAASTSRISTRSSSMTARNLGTLIPILIKVP